jgi:hypothetical protein
VIAEQAANAAPAKIDFSKYPLITCQVVFSHGSFFGFLPPKKGDSFSLNLQQIKNLKKLEFNQENLSYIPLSQPLQLDQSTAIPPSGYVNIRFAAEDGSGRKLYIDIQQYDAQQPVSSTVWIIHEDQILQSAALLNCQFRPLSKATHNE